MSSNKNLVTKKKKKKKKVIVAFYSILPGPVANVLQKWSVILPARHRVYSGPAIFTVVLQASHTATKEWSRLSIALNTMTLITDLVV